MKQGGDAMLCSCSSSSIVAMKYHIYMNFEKEAHICTTMWVGGGEGGGGGVVQNVAHIGVVWCVPVGSFSSSRMNKTRNMVRINIAPVNCFKGVGFV